MERPRIGIDDLRHDGMSSAVGTLFRTRLAFIPIVLTILLAYVFVDPSTTRRVVASVTIGVIAIISVVEHVRLRRRGVVPGMMVLNVAAMLALQGIAIAVTGGVYSVYVPTLLGAVIVFTMLLSARGAQICVAAQIAFVVALGALQATNLLGAADALTFANETPRSGAFTTFTRTILTSLFIIGVHRTAAALRQSFETMAQRALTTRDEALQGYADEARALTTLAGEIAHELKNPLASVKGLAALVSKDVDGRTAECVEVMRREIDRMQGILDEFLNFSRPLVPLTQEDVDVAELCADTAALHAGLAADRGVLIRVDARSSIVARCDRRKVKQILVNLLQNAIAASPRNAEITMEACESTHEGASAVRVVVRDHGQGLAADVADRVFDAGVTTKSAGSGLGLTVSRALARQHGGELTLRNATDGCEGELVLPRYGAPAQEAA